MNADDFEQQLQRQPLRPVPQEWRREILKAAEAVAISRSSAFNSALISWCRALFWPCPQAWAGLAAVWVLILGLHLVAGSEPRPAAGFAALEPSPECRAFFAEQQRLFTELLAHPEASPVRHPAEPAARPRSQRRWPAEFPTTETFWKVDNSIA